jgi:hypothetical protein
MQSEAVGSAYSTWRRNWKGPNKEYSAGAIIWQLNDTWPVTSWAIIDYFVCPTSISTTTSISQCGADFISSIDRNQLISPSHELWHQSL